MKNSLRALAFISFLFIVNAIRDCEKGIENKYCTDPKLVWTEHHDGKCYKGHCQNGMEYCKEVECEGLVSRSFEDSIHSQEEMEMYQKKMKRGEI